MCSIIFGKTICPGGCSFGSAVAAKRGVHVRLLLDDNNTPGLDDTLRLLDSHPNIEVRLFNPFSFRTLRALGYLTDFARLNRRMHNKSYTADGVVTLVGGATSAMPISALARSRYFPIWT
ncbi:Cardiolipin synthetase [Salmonella enterica subsp. enterica]|uniref:Cardiolipin synthetase n=1 Tax=Salmonella enterica I TaxID=59201 RepID=A0A379WWF3_SALET|nr:Cardiolipin synthetase [Salmonella enterica subsp. enterica]